MAQESNSRSSLTAWREIRLSGATYGGYRKDASPPDCITRDPLLQRPRRPRESRSAPFQPCGLKAFHLGTEGRYRPVGRPSAPWTADFSGGKSACTVLQMTGNSIRSYWCRSQFPMPRMSRQRGPGQRASAAAPSRIAASLIICSLRSTAATVFGSSLNSSRSMPEVNLSIMSMASAISRSESSSSLKGKHRLPRGPLTNAVLHGFRGR